MRATVMFGAGDVRIENVPDARLVEPTDALVTVTRACICGSDLWPYKTMEHTESIIRSIISPQAESATIKLVPRQASS